MHNAQQIQYVQQYEHEITDYLLAHDQTFAFQNNVATCWKVFIKWISQNVAASNITASLLCSQRRTMLYLQSHQTTEAASLTCIQG